MEEGLNASAQECGLNLEELAAVLQPIIESCTKDAISAGKNYIFSHSISDKHADVSVSGCLEQGVVEIGVCTSCKDKFLFIYSYVVCFRCSPTTFSNAWLTKKHLFNFAFI